MRSFKTIVTTIIIMTTLLVGVSALAKGDVAFLSLSIDSNDNGWFAKDAENNDIGIADFSIANGKIYLLSSKNNHVYIYYNNRRVEEVNLDQYGFKAIRISVHGEYTWIYNNIGQIVLLENWREKGVISLYDFSKTEAFQDFRTNGKNLFISCASPTEKGYVTYRLTLSDEKIFCTETVDGRIVNDHIIENSQSIKEKLSNITSLIAEKDGYVFKHQFGVMDLGEGENSCRYYLSREIIENGAGEYYIQRIYCYKPDGQLKQVYTLPLMIPTCFDPVKMINGKVYVLVTQEDGIVVDTLERIPYKDISNCLLPISWSKVNEASNKWSEKTLENESILSAPSSVTRFSCISRIDSYCTPFSWSCSAANLLPLSGWECPSYVTGPGTYLCMPYCWGGFSDWAGYNAGIQNGYRVGNVNLENVLNNTVGVDCSGLVSRALLLPYHHSTYLLSSIATSISFSSIQMADFFLLQGTHVMMYYYSTPLGNYMIYESTTSFNYDKCTSRLRTPEGLAAYTLYTYNGFVD